MQLNFELGYDMWIRTSDGMGGNQLLPRNKTSASSADEQQEKGSRRRKGKGEKGVVEYAVS